MILSLLRNFDIGISSGDLPIKNYDQWLADSEHGMVHGYLVAFFANQAHGPDRRLVLSCLIHDCMKCAGKEPHDALLLDEHPDLDPATYTHSNPPNENHPLVIGDRLELMRYPDYESWVETDRLNLLFPFSQLQDFYQQREIVEKLVRDKWC
jgi:hypothetical protein